MPGFEPGTIIEDRYEIISHIAEGGMGEVYKAREIGLGRLVALKILHQGLLGDEESLQRFEREGRILSALSHPNILCFYRFGIWNRSYPYIAMEYLEGQSLRALVDKIGRVPVKRMLNITKQICSALEYAHNKDIFHRDLTPNNVMLLDFPEPDAVKIIDFGLARTLPSSGAQNLTQTGLLIGSVYYMSPEQCLGKRSDHRSDIYSLGCVVYESITGTVPFQADNPVGLLHKHVNEDPAPLSGYLTKGEKDLGIGILVSKSMEKDPAARYQSMADMEADLDRLISGVKVEAGPGTVPGSSKGSSGKLLVPLILSILILAIGGISFLWLRSRQIEMNRADEINLGRSSTTGGSTKTPIGSHAKLALLMSSQPGKRRLEYAMEMVQKLKANRGSLPLVDQVTVYKVLAESFCESDRASEAIPFLDDFLSYLVASSGPPAAVAEVYSSKGSCLNKCHKFEESEIACRQAFEYIRKCEHFNANDRARLGMTLGVALFRQGRIDEAQEEVESALRTIETASKEWYASDSIYLTELYLISAQPEKERRLYVHLLKVLPTLRPDSRTAFYINLCSTLNVYGERKLSLARLDDILNRSSEHLPTFAIVDLLCVKGNTLVLESRYDEAIATFKKAIDIGPVDNASADRKAALLMDLGKAYGYSGNYPESERCFVSVIENDKVLLITRESALVTLIESMITQRKSAEIKPYIDQLSKLIESSPESTRTQVVVEWYCFIAGKIATRLKDYELSKYCMERCVAILALKPPDSWAAARARGNLGAYMSKTGKLEKGEELLSQALLLYSNEHMVPRVREEGLFKEYACCMRGMGKFDEATAFLKKLVESEKREGTDLSLLAKLIEVGRAFDDLGLLHESIACYEQGSKLPVGKVGLLNHLKVTSLLIEDLALANEPGRAIAVVDGSAGEMRKLNVRNLDDAQCEFDFCLASVNAFRGLSLRDRAFSTAMRAVKVAEQHKQIDLFGALMLLADVLVEMDKFDAALSVIDEVMNRTKDRKVDEDIARISIALRRAFIATRQGHVLQGVSMLETLAAEHEKHDFEKHDSLLVLEITADAETSAGNFDKSMFYMNQAMKLAGRKYSLKSPMYERVRLHKESLEKLIEKRRAMPAEKKVG